MHEKETRRSFCRTAAGVGVALSLSTGRAVFSQSEGNGDRFRVGLIGTDGHTGVLLGPIARLPNVDLTAFAKSLPDDDARGVRRNKAFSETTRIYDQFEEMLDQEELDVVGICLPYYRNAEASIAAARKGIHIVSEKPVATTFADLASFEEGRGRIEGPSHVVDEHALFSGVSCSVPGGPSRPCWGTDPAHLAEIVPIRQVASLVLQGDGDLWRNDSMGWDPLDRLHEVDHGAQVRSSIGLAWEPRPCRLPGFSGPCRSSVPARQRRNGDDQPRLPASGVRPNPR